MEISVRGPLADLVVYRSTKPAGDPLICTTTLYSINPRSTLFSCTDLGMTCFILLYIV